MALVNFLTVPSLSQIFSDFGYDGWATSYREFLGYFVKQFWPGVNTQIDKLPFTRLDYPLLVLPFFLLVILALFSFWERPSARRAILAGLASGVLFYTYFSAWVYGVIVIGLLAIGAIVFFRKDPERTKGIIVLLGTLALMALPYVINYFQFANTPGSRDFLYRQWLSEGREPGLVSLGFAYLTYFLLAAIISWLYAKRDRVRALFSLALVVAMAIVWNVQLVTGFVPAPDHWKRIISPVIFITVAAIVSAAVERSRQRWPALPRLALIVLLVAAGLVVTKKIVNVVSLSRGLQPWVATKHAFPQELYDSWAWIEANLGREPKIIAASTMTSQYLAVYTSARPYVPYGILTPLPMAEVEARYLAASKLFRVPEDILRAELGAAEKIPPACRGSSCYDLVSNFTKTPFNLYGCYFWRKPFNASIPRSCGVPPEHREALVDRYRSLRATWADVDAEYVYFGPHERQFSQPDFRRDPHLVLVYGNPLVEIYRIERE